jgi:hypothetical protein
MPAVVQAAPLVGSVEGQLPQVQVLFVAPVQEQSVVP